MSERKRKQTQFTISKETNAKIDSLAEIENMNRSRLIEKAIDFFWEFVNTKKIG